MKVVVSVVNSDLIISFKLPLSEIDAEYRDISHHTEI
jgi:hypothetical protein